MGTIFTTIFSDFAEKVPLAFRMNIYSLIFRSPGKAQKVEINANVKCGNIYYHDFSSFCL